MTFFSKFPLQLDYLNPFDDPTDIVTLDDQIAGGVDLAIAFLSITLTVLAISAYKKTKVPQLRYVALAFSLFTVFLGIEAIQEFLPINDDSFDLLLSIVILLILISFFFGIMKKRNNNN